MSAKSYINKIMLVNKKEFILLIIAALGWGLSGVILKIVEMEALTIAFYRSAIADIFLSLCSIRSGLLKVNWYSTYTAVAYALAVIFLVVATKETTAPNAIILHYSAPAFVFLLAIPMLREIPEKRNWLVLICTMLGVLCISSQGFDGALKGIVYGLLSGVGFALLTILLRLYRDHNPVHTTAFNNIFVALFLLPWVWDSLWLAPREMGLMIIMGIFQLGLPYVTYTFALRSVIASDAALISLLEPLLNPIWVFLFVSELPASMTFIGACFIMGCFLLRFSSK